VFGPNNQLFKQLVELQGSTTVLSSVGEQALQAAIKDHPDLIIVDVMGSQEFEFGKISKGDVRAREIPLIGVSAHDEHLVVAAGYDEFVAKPIGSPELPQVAGQIIAANLNDSRPHQPMEMLVIDCTRRFPP